MGVFYWIVPLIIGAAAGWLAGQMARGYGFGLLGNMGVGLLGALIAGVILPQVGFLPHIGLGIVGRLVAAIIHASIGAALLVYLIRFVKDDP